MGESKLVVLADPADVADLLGRDLEPSEKRRTEALLKQASAQIKVFTGHDYHASIPEEHAMVAAAMVARVMGADTGLVGVTQESDTTGPFTFARSFAPSFSDGGVWLSATDKQLLGGGRRYASVPLVSERFQ